MWQADDCMGQSIGRNEAEVGKGQIAHGRPCGSCKRLCTESSTQREILGFLAWECYDAICSQKTAVHPWNECNWLSDERDWETFWAAIVPIQDGDEGSSNL